MYVDDRCTNNQAEQLAIIKALEVIETQQVKQNEHWTAVIYMDSSHLHGQQNNTGRNKER